MPYLNEDDSKRNLNLNWWNDDWNPDYRFLAVRHFHVSPALTSGSFVLQLLAPSAKHSADFRKTFREDGIFFRIKSPHFPRELNEQFQKVYEREVPQYRTRHLITPGLSGWAQIHDYDAPRGGADVERTKRKVSYDLYYLKHRSLGLDLAIAIKTLRTLLAFSGT